LGGVKNGTLGHQKTVLVGKLSKGKNQTCAEKWGTIIEKKTKGNAWILEKWRIYWGKQVV